MKKYFLLVQFLLLVSLSACGSSDYSEDGSYDYDTEQYSEGYSWASDNYIYDTDDCYGGSDSFTAGCEAFVYSTYEDSSYEDSSYESDPSVDEYSPEFEEYYDGYSWARDNYIYDTDDCYGGSEWFTAGCEDYVMESAY